MNETLIQYRERLTQYWKQLTRTQKTMFFGSLALIILVLTILFYQLSKTEYSLAFTDLSPSDASEIKNYLESSNIPYQLSADGSAIGVPTKKVAAVKIDAESQGLLKNGTLGYGIFRKNISSFGMTENQFNVLNIDARAGEIQMLLNQMSGVKSSKVMIHVPEESAFIRDQDQLSSASVIVHFVPGSAPDQHKIDTMYSLVSKSVPKLSVEQITISDQNGELIPSTKMNGGLGHSTSLAEQQFQIKKQYEQDITRNIQSFLSPILGRERVVVSVFSSLNFDQKNSEQNLVTPVHSEDETGIDISIQELQKSIESDTGTVGGVPGTGQTDVPGYPSANEGGSSSSEEISRTINREVNRIHNSIVSSPYVVKDLAISVGVEPNPSNPNSITPELLGQINQVLVNIVSTALAEAGQEFTMEQLSSKVSVIAQSFEGKQISASSDSGDSTILWLAGGLAALLVGGGVLAMRRRKSAQNNNLEQESAELRTEGEGELELDLLSPDDQVRNQLESLAKKKPEEFVSLLRTWLVDE